MEGLIFGILQYQINIFLSTNSLRKQKEISLENLHLNIEPYKGNLRFKLKTLHVSTCPKSLGKLQCSTVSCT